MRVDKLAANITTSSYNPKPFVLMKKTIVHNADCQVSQLLKSMGIYNIPLIKNAESLANVVFDKGIAKNIDGSLYSGIIKDTLKNGKNVELSYQQGRWLKSKISRDGNSYVVEKFAKYNSDNQLAEVKKICLQNGEPVLAKVTKFTDDYVKAKRCLDIDTTKFKPVKKGQSLSKSELDRCFRADFFKEYNPEKYTGLGIIEENKSHIFERDNIKNKWNYEGIVDNLQRLMNNLKG